MPPVYRGEIKVQGRTLRGWLANAGDPNERVAFDLVIDGEVKGFYLADRPYLSIERYRAFGDGAHGFTFQLDRDWISGGVQNVVLATGGAPTGVELHAALGPAAAAYFDEKAGEPGPPPRRLTTVEEAEAYRELTECRRLRRSASTERERAKCGARYFEILEGLSLAETSETGWRNSLLLGRELYDAHRFDEAAATAERTLTAEPENFRALMTLGRSLIALNRSGEARAVFARALVLEPENLGARFYARVTETLASGEPVKGTATLGTVALDGDGMPAGEGSLAARLAQLTFDWVRLTHDADDTEHPPEAIAALNEPMMQQIGCANLPTGGKAATYWRREALIGLADSGLLERLDGENAPPRWRRYFVSHEGRRTDPTAVRKVALIARTGNDTALAGIAQHYAALGYDTVTTHAETARELRRFILEQGATLAHVMAGLGHQVAEALAFSNIPFIYGVHSADDMFDGTLNGASVHVRPEFDVILTRAAMVYAGSQNMRDTVEHYFDVRCPILFSREHA